MSYRPPVREHLFLLGEVLAIEQYKDLPGFADASLDVVRQILDEAARFASEVLDPLNAVGDKQGCRRNDDGSVTTPPGFKKAYRALMAGGWPALGAAPGHREASVDDRSRQQVQRRDEQRHADRQE